MTTEDIIVHIFYLVDERMKTVKRVPQTHLYPSEIVTIGILFALKGGHFRAFYRWLKRDFAPLFAGVPDRTNLQRLLKSHQQHCDALLAEASVLTVTDSYPIELIFPIRQGRSERQVGKKNKDKGRWSIGIKLCWLVNTFGQVVGWQWATMNRPDQDFHPLIEAQQDDSIVLADLGFRCKDGIPANLKLCAKGTWNDRMVIETIFSMLTVVCKAKKMHHRVQAYLEARLAYMAAMFNVLLHLFHHLHPDADPYQLSIAEFSL
jgi:hypothetical protein